MNIEKLMNWGKHSFFIGLPLLLVIGQLTWKEYGATVLVLGYLATVFEEIGE